MKLLAAGCGFVMAFIVSFLTFVGVGNVTVGAEKANGRFSLIIAASFAGFVYASLSVLERREK